MVYGARMSLPHDTALDEKPVDTDDLKDVHSRAMKRFDQIAIEQQEVREQSLEARRFVTIPGAQWDGEWGEQFQNAIKIESDKLRKIVSKIETDYRENRIVPFTELNFPFRDSIVLVLDK